MIREALGVNISLPSSTPCYYGKFLCRKYSSADNGARFYLFRTGEVELGGS